MLLIVKPSQSESMEKDLPCKLVSLASKEHLLTRSIYIGLIYAYTLIPRRTPYNTYTYTLIPRRTPFLFGFRFLVADLSAKNMC